MESLSAKIILEHIQTQRIGRNVVFRNSMTSTMDVALEEVAQGAPSGTAVICETQSHGQGRLAREWESPPGGVYLSIILYPRTEVIPSLMMIASLAVTGCIETASGIKAEIKWPNDVLVNGKKVAGILARSGCSSEGKLYAVIGIGINVNLDVSQYPEIAGSATSLSAIKGSNISRVDVIASLLNNFEKRLGQLESGEPIWQDWQTKLVTLGKQVSIKSGNQRFDGLAETVNPSGSILLRLADGSLKEIPAGDVTLRA
jgi:BirA family transcriptional regulator, biotin operon repressor / biotin---[acetyl-CoA-carboxylase] ligase